MEPLPVLRCVGPWHPRGSPWRVHRLESSPKCEIFWGINTDFRVLKPGEETRLPRTATPAIPDIVLYALNTGKSNRRDFLSSMATCGLGPWHPTGAIPRHLNTVSRTPLGVRHLLAVRTEKTARVTTNIAN